MLVAGTPNHRPHSLSSTSPNNLNNRISVVSSSHSLYPHHPLPTNDGPSFDVPPVPTSSETRGNTLYDHSRRSTHSSASSNALAPRPQSTRTSSCDLLINLQSPPVQSFAEHGSTPSTSTLSSATFNPQPNPASVAHTPATENNSQQLPPSSDRHGDKDAYTVSRHQHNRSSSRSSIMSALLAVAPLQQLKIANRTKLDELDDDEHEMSSKFHHSL